MTIGSAAVAAASTVSVAFVALQLFVPSLQQGYGLRAIDSLP